MGEANTARRAKEEECGKLAKERDLLAAQLAEQRELLQKAQDEAKTREAALMAEFERERSAWTDKEAMLTSGYHEIEDIVDDFFPGHSQAVPLAIEAAREARRAKGEEIAANAPRTIDEQLLSIETRLRPAHRLLRRLQRAGA